MKVQLLLVTGICLIQSAKAQIQADQVIVAGPCNPITLLSCPYGVADAQNAVDKSNSNFATIKTELGIANEAYLTLGFSQHGLPGMYCNVIFQKGETLLTADVLKAVSISLYDSDDKLVGKKAGFQLANVEALNSSGDIFGLRVSTDPGIKDIARVKIKLGGLADILNSLRVYSARLNMACAPAPGIAVHGSLNVQNPINAVTENEDDYALLTPPLLLGSAYLDVEMFEAVKPGKAIRIRVGEGNHLIDATLLKNVTLAAYASDGSLVSTASNITLADVDLLEDGTYLLHVNLPKTGKPAVRGRITLQGLLNVLTTMRVYEFNSSANQKPIGLKVISSGGNTICPGQTVSLSVQAKSGVADGSYQWYRNNQIIANGTQAVWNVTEPGVYFANVTGAGGCSSVSKTFEIKQGNCLTSFAEKTNKLLNIYPNPFTQTVTIVATAEIKSTTIIMINDKTSSKTWQYKLSAGGSIKALADAPTGIYFVRVIANGNTETYKLIKL